MTEACIQGSEYSPALEKACVHPYPVHHLPLCPATGLWQGNVGGGCGHRPCLAREQPEGPPPSFLVLERWWDMLTGGGRLLGHCSGHHPAGTSSVDRTHWTHGGPGYLSLQRIGAADPTMALHTADGSHGQ